MTMPMTRRTLLGAAAAGPLLGGAGRRKVLLISVDGLDQRYLSENGRLGLRIPTLRRLMREGQCSEGVTGEAPTVTWPMHTTLLTGVPPRLHGILGNRRPRPEGGDYYWTTDLIRVRTLWDACREAKLTAAAITWPVTVTERIPWNLPEFFRRRRGGAMDMESIAEKAVPADLAGRIARDLPSFPQQWMDDRSRALAAIWILRNVQPDFLALHFVDLDSEAHDCGPFTREANAILEYTDELVAWILEAAPPDMLVALVSDHGFERVEKVVDLAEAMRRDGAAGKLDVSHGVVWALDSAAARWLEEARARGNLGIGRRVPEEELKDFTPELAGVEAAYEAAEGFLFGRGESGELYAKPHEAGVHGLWPGRPDYRSAFILWGKGIEPARLPPMRITAIAGRLAELLGVRL